MDNTEKNKVALRLDELMTVTAAPHVRSSVTTGRIMGDVLLALLPSLAVGVYFFGIRALTLTLVAVASCVASEYFFQKALGRKSSIGDLSAVVTGVLIAFNVPVTLPYWMMIFAGFFAMVVVKGLFGGIGSNFMNPALAARAVLMASWPKAMANYTAPHTDMVAMATPLSGGEAVTLWDAFIGHMGGCIGEVSALALLLGAAYLLIRGVIGWRIPVVYIATTAAALLCFGVPLAELGTQLFLGGLILGAFFMATDYASSPMIPRAQWFYALGCGILTAVIRQFGALPEGVSYSILFMNVATPFLEKISTPKIFGGERR